MRFSEELIEEAKDYFLEEKGLDLTDDVVNEYLLSLSEIGRIVLDKIKIQLDED